MLNIALQISVYISIAIILGYSFGWLITKLSLEKRYKQKIQSIIVQKERPNLEISELKEKLFQLRRENKNLEKERKKVDSMYEGQKYVLNEHNEVLDDFQKRLLKKDEIIEELTKKLSSLEQRQLRLNKKHEEEIDAFVFERVEITQKYKDLMEKYKLIKNSKIFYQNNASWFSKLFFSPSKSS
jgi:predicted RNase H-like nuclease (RuvC/YqgF family)